MRSDGVKIRMRSFGVWDSFNRESNLGFAVCEIQIFEALMPSFLRYVQYEIRLLRFPLIERETKYTQSS